MLRISFLLAIFVASSSLSETALASHRDRVECDWTCHQAFLVQARACRDENGERDLEQLCARHAKERQQHCRADCDIAHPDVRH